MRSTISAFYLVLLMPLLMSYACNQSSTKSEFKSPPHYDLNNPRVVNLPHDLDEVSGIDFYQKDTSVFAVVDESGTFYKLYLRNKPVFKSWKFDKKQDFEDVVRVDSAFYALISNGDISVLTFSGDSIIHKRVNFGEGSKKKNEFEILYYDDQRKQLIMMCKECQDDKNSEVSAFAFDPATKTYSDVIWKLNVKLIEQKMNRKKMELKPSAAAINPITNELYIVSAVSNLLVIADRNGNFKEGYDLDVARFNQPEGITFTPTGDMLISNEIADKEHAKILIFKYIK